MLLSLVKKDFILVKKYALFMAAFCFLLPDFFLSRLPEFAGSLTFFISVVYTIFLLLQYVFLKEYQSPKAALLLCASPYPRRLMVLGKYVFCLVLYAASSLIYWINTQIFPELGGFHWEMAVLIFFMVTIFYSLYIPLEYRLGFESTKVITMFIIMACPFAAPFILQKGAVIQGYIGLLPPMLFYGALLFVSLTALVISACLSVCFYEHADLSS